ncbi:hypothetical protein FACS1894172_18050 [Spirochaetia bacterium]|nr:hypothetical protein FACS1894172_18050 [Spirochaetia bacterium]
MERKFLNYRKTECTNNCLYCFTRWEAEDIKYDNLCDFRDNVIVYPMCNADISPLEKSDEILEYLERCLSMQSKFSIISISTKSNLSGSFIECIKNINNKYKENGFIKISVSFSCKYNIEIIEPSANPYSTRLSLLSNIAHYGIPHSVILKPILPFVDLKEYCEIIDDIKMFSDAVVLGALYVDHDDMFYKEYINKKYQDKKKNILWLKENKAWSTVESTDKIIKIKEYIIEKDIRYFDSDSEYLHFLVDGR